MFIIFRTITSQELLRRAEIKINSERDSTVGYSSKFLVPHKDDVWGSGEKQINKQRISLAVAKLDEEPRCDEYFMRKFLQRSPTSGMIDPGLDDFEKMIPCGSPIIEFLRSDAQRTDSWRYPSKEDLDDWRENRGFTANYPSKVDVREIVAGVTPEEEIVKFAEWIESKIQDDNRQMPTNVISLDVEEIPITNFDYIRMGMPQYIGKEIHLTRKLGEYTEEEKELFEDRQDFNMNLPVKVMFGNGHSWAALISIPLHRVSSTYVYTGREISKLIPVLLNSLPVCQGLGIRNDVDMIQLTYTYLSGERVKLKGFIDLESLAVLAGWRLEATNMTAMSMIALGFVMNKCVSKGDKKWGLLYDELPSSLKAYAIADLKFGHFAYNVLIAALIREMFPDPEICCKFSQIDQFGFVKWFCNWIKDVLEGTAVYNPARKAANTREDLIFALRYRDLYGNLSAYPPARVKTLASLIHGKVPTITCGGARYLHAARDHYVDQYQILHEAKIDPDMFGSPLTSDQRWYARFGLRNVKDIDMKAPIPSEGRDAYPTALLIAREFRRKIIYPSTYLTFDGLNKEARRVNRDKKAVVYEWARANPKRNIQRFLDMCGENDAFAKAHKGYYEDLRLMYFAIVGSEPVKPESVEKKRSEAFTKRYELELEKKSYLETALQRQEDIVKSLEATNHLPSFMSRDAWKDLPFAPVKERQVVFVNDLRREPFAPTIPPATQAGRPAKIQMFEHRRPATVQDFTDRRPWVTRESERQSYAWEIPIQPATQREDDEHELGALASKSGKRKKKSGSSAASAPPPSKSSRIITPDEVDEYPGGHSGFEYYG